MEKDDLKKQPDNESKDELDAERLTKLTQEMIETISHPSFVKAMKIMKATPQSERLEVAKKVLSQEALISNSS